MIFDRIFDAIQNVMLLTRETQQHAASIKDLKEEVRRLSEETKRLGFEIERLKDVHRYERETMLLQLDNTLLQFERRLPPPAN